MLNSVCDVDFGCRLCHVALLGCPGGRLPPQEMKVLYIEILSDLIKPMLEIVLLSRSFGMRRIFFKSPLSREIFRQTKKANLFRECIFMYKHLKRKKAKNKF